MYIKRDPLHWCHDNGDANNEFETLAVGEGNNCWSTMKWGALDSKSQCTVGAATRYNDGTYERIFAFFREPDDYSWP